MDSQIYDELVKKGCVIELELGVKTKFSEIESQLYELQTLLQDLK